MHDTPATYFPAFLDLKDRAVLVIGAGEVALRKIRLLLPTGAHIRVAAKELHDEIKTLVQSQRVVDVHEYRRRRDGFLSRDRR